MTVAEVTKRLVAIRNAKDDPEHAHAMEDVLWHDVLRAIADGDCVDDPKDIAGTALWSIDIEFHRRYA